MILYYDCDGSLGGRNAINDRLAPAGFQWIDCTGGQAAFEDGDLEAFGKVIVEAARELGVKVHNILRMDDPGLGLTFNRKWLEEGLDKGNFQRFPLPDDVYAGNDGGYGAPFSSSAGMPFAFGPTPDHVLGGKGNGYTYSQNEDDAELRIPVSRGTKAKYAKVKFEPRKLKVVVSGQTLLSGKPGGTVDVAGSTFTIEDASDGPGKELCVTLSKKEKGIWPVFVFRRVK